MKLCERCGKYLAVVFVSTQQGDRTNTKGLCLSCARAVGLTQVDDMMREMGITEEDIEGLQRDMVEEWKSIQGDTVEDLENIQGDTVEDLENIQGDTVEDLENIQGDMLENSKNVS